MLVTSPGSPDLHSVRNYSSSRYSNRLAPAGTVTQENSVGGRVQIKLGFEPSSLQLIVTILCANGLVPRGNGAARNPYVKVSFSPDYPFILLCAYVRKLLPPFFPRGAFFVAFSYVFILCVLCHRFVCYRIEAKSRNDAPKR